MRGLLTPLRRSCEQFTPQRRSGNSRGLSCRPISSVHFKRIARTEIVRLVYGRTFQLNRGLGFVVDHAAAEHHGGNGIEETAEA